MHITNARTPDPALSVNLLGKYVNIFLACANSARALADKPAGNPARAHRERARARSHETCKTSAQICEYILECGNSERALPKIPDAKPARAHRERAHARSRETCKTPDRWCYFLQHVIRARKQCAHPRTRKSQALRCKFIVWKGKRDSSMLPKIKSVTTATKTLFQK